LVSLYIDAVGGRLLSLPPADVPPMMKPFEGSALRSEAFFAALSNACQRSSAQQLDPWWS